MIDRDRTLSAEQLLALFKQHHFDFQVYEHEPLFSSRDGLHLLDVIKGAHCKSLFLKDKTKTFFLVSLLENKRVDLKALSDLIGSHRLSFANPCELFAMLNLTPGSVTPYGLVHDHHQQIQFFLDEEMLSYDIVNFHPLRNDMTVGMPLNQFLTFFDLIKHQPKTIAIPVVTS